VEQDGSPEKFVGGDSRDRVGHHGKKHEKKEREWGFWWFRLLEIETPNQSKRCAVTCKSLKEATAVPTKLWLRPHHDETPSVGSKEIKLSPNRYGSPNATQERTSEK
jgi:hypothetical protein